MPKLPPIPLTDKQLANQALTEAAKKQASETKKLRELNTAEEKWASHKLPQLKSPNSLSKKMRLDETINSSIFVKNLDTEIGKLPSQVMSKDKSHSQNKSSDATDPFEVKGSVAS